MTMEPKSAPSQRVAVVTGATRGIGKAIALALAQAGYKVILTGRSDGQAVAQAMHTQCQPHGGEAHFHQLDITDEAAVETFFEMVQARHGGCDVLVNNAGIAKDFLLMRSKVSDWQELIQTNLVGTLLCSRSAIRPMMKKKWGRIINISSVIGEIGNAGQSVYAATKAGIIGITKSLAKEIGSRQITVNAIAPGLIATDMTQNLSTEVQQDYLKTVPLQRIGTPEDVAQTALFLASEGAGYITGQVLGVNGGMA